MFLGGGLTSDNTCSDAHLHEKLNSAHRLEETKLAMAQLPANPEKVPPSTRLQMLEMVEKEFRSFTIDLLTAFKQNFLTNSLDATEGYLVFTSLHGMVKDDICPFPNKLLRRDLSKKLSLCSNKNYRGRCSKSICRDRSRAITCSNALPFNLVHFPIGDSPGKLTQRNNIRRGIMRAFWLSYRIATRSHKIAKDDSFNAQPIGKKPRDRTTVLS